MLNEATQSMIEAVYPLSPVQQGMLFYSVATPKDDTYVIQWSCTFPQSLQPQHFEHAWQRVIARHPILRTAFLWQDLEEPLQIVGRHATAQVTFLDWRERVSAHYQEDLDTWLEADRSQGFSLSSPPLMRLTLIQQPDVSYRFIWTYHHLLLDGWSWPLVLQEVFAFYEALVQGQELSLPKARPYRDYIAWLQQQDLHQAEAFWRQMLAGFTEATPLGLERAFFIEGLREVPTSDVLEFQFTSGESQTFYSFARQHKITMNTLIQGAWALLLREYSDNNDVVFGSVVSGRPFEMDGVDTMVGMFINTLPVRVRLPDAQSCQTWLRELQWQQLEARQYEYSPLFQVQKWSDVPPGQPLFETLLVYENFPVDPTARERGRNLQVHDSIYHGRTNYPLTLAVEGRSELTFRLAYDAQRYDAGTIQRLGEHFQHLLRVIVADPQQPLAQISAISPQERVALLMSFNQTASTYPNQAMHEFFEEQVRRTPDAVAAVFAEERVTYRELNRRANWFAHHLLELGVGPERLVGLYVERSIDMLVGLLAILKAGGTYVPLDPTHPQDRLAYILEDTGTSLILTQLSLAQQLPPHQAQLFLLDEDWASQLAEKENPALSVSADQLAYIIYTSGSTGKPKGVLVPHRGIANIVHTQRAYLPDLSPQSRVVQFASFCFDASVWEIMMALAAGASLFLGSRESLKVGPNLVHFLREYAITIAALPPAVLAALAVQDQLPALRTVLTGGEACSLDVVQRWGREKPLYNFYGPTETTIASTGTLCDPNLAMTPSIGKPILNTQVYLLNQRLAPVHLGGVGEIYLGGAGVTRGYLNRPDLTAERYLPDPFSKVPGARLYKTGDLARFLPDGQLEYLGRNDRQVKIRGYRIELGEIENALRQHAALQDAVTLIREEKGAKHLVAYLLAPQTAVTVAQLRQFLKARLPEYMVPSSFVFLDAFPLTTNGKVDRQALLAYSPQESNLAPNYVAPQTTNQALLVEVWARVLGREQVGIHDNFFELGGDSIISLQIVAGAAQVGLELTLRQLFQYPTIAELSLHVGQIGTRLETEAVVQGIVPLSPIQQWFLEQAWENPHHFNQAQLCMVPDDLDMACLEAALCQLLRHHDALRMRFTRLADGRWQQENLDVEHSICQLKHCDLSALHPAVQVEAMQKALLQTHTSLNLSAGPLVQATLFSYGTGQPGKLLIVIHHMIVDMVSWRLLLEDLQTAYTQLTQGEKIHLPAKTSSFKRWAEHLVAYAQRPEVQEELLYWQAIGKEVAPSLPVDSRTGENTVAATDIVTFSFTPEETQILLQRVPAIYHTQINDVLLLALALALKAWTGQSTALIDLEGHGREDIDDSLDLSRTVGWFTSVFPVCLKLPTTGHIGRLLMGVKEQLRAIPRRGIGYGVLRYLNDEGRTKLHPIPLAEIGFNYLGQFSQTTAEARYGHFSLSSEFSGVPHSPQAPRAHLLDLAGAVKDGQLWLTCEYSQHMYQRATIERFAHYYLQALREIITHCQGVQTRKYTPSDFPLAQLNQEQLERILEGNEIEDLYPLSPLQQGLLFHTLYTPHAGTYMVQRALQFTGALDAPLLIQCWQDTVKRHAILRTAFVWEGLEEPLQVVHRTSTLAVQELDWSEVPEQEQRASLEQLLRAERVRDFDLARPTLLRLFLIRLSEQRWYFVENFHHLLLDGWSAAQLQQEIFGTYLAWSQQVPFALEPVKPYRDYIAWLGQQDSKKAEHFWKEQLAGIEAPTPLPFDTEAREAPAGYAHQTMLLSSELTAQLDALARQFQITLNTLLQGAWAFLLGRYSGQSDVVYGTTVAGRPAHLPGSQRMVGLFINTLPMHVQIAHTDTFVDWLKRIQEQQADMQQYDYCSLVQIQSWSRVPQRLSLFESLFVFENYLTSSLHLDPQAHIQLSAEQLCSVEQTNYPLTLVVEPGSALSFQVIYERRRFAEATIERLLGHIRAILDGLISQPQQRLIDLTYLTSNELNRLHEQYNRTTTDYPRSQTIQQRFTEQALLSPEAVAGEYSAEQLTYRELNMRANCLAHYLRAQGLKPGTFVALYMERSPEMLVALLGILKAGGAYVPLDLTYPAERIAFMLADTAAPVLITQAALLEQLPAYEGLRLCLDRDWSAIARFSSHEPEENSTADHPAYMIYTSGSTGVPKGVCVPHKGVLRLICETNYMHFDQDQRIAQMSNTSFDAATFEIWGALLHGGCLVGIAREISLAPEDLARVVRQKRISALFVTTALFNQIAQTVPSLFQTVKTVLFGGEAVDPQWVREVLQKGAPQRLLHVYGPTESTTFATWYEVVQVAEQATTIPIGRPLANTTCFVLDAALQPVSPGVPGELYIGGDGLATGYWQRPETTAERFIPCPWGLEPGARLYRTGDLVKMQDDGVIVFLGRADSQVKLRGFRIELGEIEAVVMEQEGINGAVVLLREDMPGEKHLVAYVLASVSLDRARLHLALQAKLPAYMLPSVFVQVDAWPLTPNGKIDRSRLPVPSSIPQAHQRAYLAPRNEVERQLVQVWEQVLHVHPIGVTDDFFALGGHSLLAIRLVAQIQQRFGQRLALPQLFEHGTVEKLARILSEQGNVEPLSPLVALQPRGSRPPLFCVHPGSGNVFPYQALARALGDDQPVYAFQDVSVYADTPEILAESIETLADRYLQELLAVQPVGPYHLGGYSFGGIVAFDMALKLRRMGQEVALLAIFDGGTPQAIRYSMGEGQDEVLLLAIVALELLRSATSWTVESLYATLQTLEPPQRFSFVTEQVQQTGLTLADTEASVQLLSRQLQVFRRRVASLSTYETVRYDRKITLLRACEIDEDVPDDLARDLGWGELSLVPVEVYSIPGHHDTLFLSPNVEVVAGCLTQCLQTASKQANETA